jgi:hypothetical protein
MTRGRAGAPHPPPTAPLMALAFLPLEFRKKTTERITKLTDRDDLRAAAKELFGDVGKRPPGPRYEMTLADVETYSQRWAENLGAGRFTTTDADIVTDADGWPLMVGRSVHTFQFNSLLLDRAHADRLGITAAIEAGEYPGVEVFDPYNTKGDN